MMTWRITQDSRGDLQTGSATCWERELVLSDPMHQSCGVGVKMPVDFVSGLQRIVQNQPTPCSSIMHQVKLLSELQLWPGCRKHALTVKLKLSLVLLFLFPKFP